MAEASGRSVGLSRRRVCASTGSEDLTLERGAIRRWSTATSDRAHDDDIRGRIPEEAPHIHIATRVHVAADEEHPHLRARVVGRTLDRHQRVDPERLDDRANAGGITNSERLRGHPELVMACDANRNGRLERRLDHWLARASAPRRSHEERRAYREPGSEQR